MHAFILTEVRWEDGETRDRIRGTFATFAECVEHAEKLKARTSGPINLYAEEWDGPFYVSEQAL